MKSHRNNLVIKNKKLQEQYNQLITTTHILSKNIYINNQENTSHNIDLIASEIKKEILRNEIEIMILNFQLNKDISEKSEYYIEILNSLISLI